MKRAFVAYALGVLGFWAAAAWNGWELFASKRGFVPASVRQSPGGYRTFNYWRGGK